MKNYLKYVIMLVMVFTSISFITSCSKDGEDSTTTSKQKNKLVGKWKYNEGDDFIFILTFNADGTGTAYEYEDGDVDTGTFYYTYDDTSNVLEIISNWEGEMYTERYVLKWINDKTFVFDDELIMKKQ